MRPVAAPLYQLSQLILGEKAMSMKLPVMPNVMQKILPHIVLQSAAPIRTPAGHRWHYLGDRRHARDTRDVQRRGAQ